MRHASPGIETRSCSVQFWISLGIVLSRILSNGQESAIGAKGNADHQKREHEAASAATPLAQKASSSKRQSEYWHSSGVSKRERTGSNYDRSDCEEYGHIKRAV
jgi:hypothetical protein